MYPRFPKPGSERHAEWSSGWCSALNPRDFSVIICLFKVLMLCMQTANFTRRWLQVSIDPAQAWTAVTPGRTCCRDWQGFRHFFDIITAILRGLLTENGFWWCLSKKWITKYFVQTSTRFFFFFYKLRFTTLKAFNDFLLEFCAGKQLQHYKQQDQCNRHIHSMLFLPNCHRTSGQTIQQNVWQCEMSSTSRTKQEENVDL